MTTEQSLSNVQELVQRVINAITVSGYVTLVTRLVNSVTELVKVV